MSDDFLAEVARKKRPEPNIAGDFDCFTCRKRVMEAHYDYQTQILTWWCPEDHKSEIKEFKI